MCVDICDCLFIWYRSDVFVHRLNKNNGKNSLGQYLNAYRYIKDSGKDVAIVNTSHCIVQSRLNFICLLQRFLCQANNRRKQIFCCCNWQLKFSFCWMQIIRSNSWCGHANFGWDSEREPHERDLGSSAFMNCKAEGVQDESSQALYTVGNCFLKELMSQHSIACIVTEF